MGVDLTMRSDELVVAKIVKRTQAKVFEGFEVGDVIQLSVEAETVGGNRGRSYAVDVRVENISKEQVTYKTFNQLGVLNNFEFARREGV